MADINMDLSVVYGEISDRLQQVADIAYDYAYDFCPVDTGYMRSTIEKDVDTDAGTAQITVGADYASYTEHRTEWFSRSLERASKPISDLWRA